MDGGFHHVDDQQKFLEFGYESQSVTISLLNIGYIAFNVD